MAVITQNDAQIYCRRLHTFLSKAVLLIFSKTISSSFLGKEFETILDHEWPPIFPHPTREKATRRVSPFLAWGDFKARSRFARSTIPEEKWGTTRSLRQSGCLLQTFLAGPTTPPFIPVFIWEPKDNFILL